MLSYLPSEVHELVCTDEVDETAGTRKRNKKAAEQLEKLNNDCNRTAGLEAKLSLAVGARVTAFTHHNGLRIKCSQVQPQERSDPGECYIGHFITKYLVREVVPIAPLTKPRFVLMLRRSMSERN